MKWFRKTYILYMYVIYIYMKYEIPCILNAYICIIKHRHFKHLWLHYYKFLSENYLVNTYYNILIFSAFYLFPFPSGRPTTLLETMRKADLWLIRTYWDLEYPHPLLPHFEFVGGLHCKPAKPLPKVNLFMVVLLGLLCIFNRNHSVLLIRNVWSHWYRGENLGKVTCQLGNHIFLSITRTQISLSLQNKVLYLGDFGNSISEIKASIIQCIRMY